MKVIGVTGGVGAGKSTVLDYLEKEQNARLLKLDDEARRMQAKGGILYDAMVSLVGRNRLLANGNLDRRAVAEAMYSDEALKRAIEALVHPAVRKRTEEAIRDAAGEGISLFVIESALLIEENYDEICDELWYIYAIEPVRRERLKASRHYSDALIDSILKRQLSDEVFRRHADVVIDNSGTPEDTRRQIEMRLNS